MSKKTIEIDDTLEERLESAIEDVKNELESYLDDNEPDTVPDLHNDLNYSGAIHEIIDGSVPIYTKEINDAWYLHGSELEQAYEDAGVGNNPRENNGMAAIYYWIEQQVNEWYQDKAEDIFEEWKVKHRAGKLKNVEIFHVRTADFLQAEAGTWQADLLDAAVKETLTGDYDQAEVEPATEEAAKGLAGYYWWTCAPGCLPDSEAVGPFETREEAEEDAVEHS